MAGDHSRTYNGSLQLYQERNLPMKSFAVLFALAVLSASVTAQPLPPGHPGVATNAGAKGAPEAQLPQKAKVLSTIAAAPYVYIEVSQNKKTLWLAANALPVKKGDVIRFDNGMVMTNFHSKTLNRTFPSVVFVNTVVVTKEKE
jgi:hypothetical protein